MNTTRLTDKKTIGCLNQTEAHMSIKDICRFGGFACRLFTPVIHTKRTMANPDQAISKPCAVD
jgi:hypothetical protein